jgi:hypothetical protein
MVTSQSDKEKWRQLNEGILYIMITEKQLCGVVTKIFNMLMLQANINFLSVFLKYSV